MRLIGREDFLPRMQLAGNPQGFEVGHRPAAAQMPQVFRPAEHRGDLGDRFLLHRGTGASAIQRVIVWIDPGSQSVGRARDRMWRLEHLASIKRMKVRVVVLESCGDFGHHGGETRVWRFRGIFGDAGQRGESAVKLLQ